MANLDNIQLDGLGTFNQSTINSGVIKYGEFNNASQNTGIVAISAVFKNSASNSGTIGNILPVIAATVLASNSANWIETYNTVVSNSASWIGGNNTSVSLDGLSGHWEDTYNAFVAHSASWMSGTYTESPELSAVISFVRSNSASLILSSDSRLTDARAPLAHVQAISTITGLQTALDNKLATGATFSSSSITDFSSSVNSQISAAAGSYVASLVNGLIPSTQLPSYVDDVLEYTALSGFPVTGESGKIYVDTTAKKIYRWSGSAYIEIAASPGSTDSVTEGSTNLYFTNQRASAAAPVQSVFGRTGAVVLSSSDVTSALGFTPVTTSDSRLTDSRNPLTHTQAISTITGLETALSNKLDTNATFTSSSVTDFNSAASSAAPVQSVAGKTGAVTLSSSDIQGLSAAVVTYAPSVSVPVQSVFGRTGAIALSASDVTGALGYTPVTNSDSRLTDARTPLAHVQSISTITGLQTALDNKLATGATFTSSSVTDFSSAASSAAPVQSVFSRTGAVVLSSSDVTGALGFTPATSSSVTTLQNTVSSKADTTSLSAYVLTSDSRLTDARTPVAHNQAISTITGLQTALDNKLATGATFTSSSVTDFSSAASSAAPVQSVAGKTGAVTLSSSDIQGLSAAVVAYAPSVSVPVQSVFGRTGSVVLSSSDVTGALGFTPVNTSDSRLTDARTPVAHTQAISTITGLQTALDNKLATGATFTSSSVTDFASSVNSQISAAAGVYVASLVNGLIPSAQLPSYVDDVLEYSALSSFPATGESGKIYVDITVKKIYRWSGSAYVEISASPGSTDSVTEGSTNLYFTNSRASAAAPVQSVAGKTGVVTLSSSDIQGLSAAVVAYAPSQLVTSVAGKTGVVTLGTSDITGFNSAASSAAPVQSVAGRTGSVTLSSSDIQGLSAAVVTYAPSVPVQSVAGKTGAVTLSSSDITGFNSAASAAAPVQSVFGRTGAVALSSSDVTGALGFTPASNSVAKGSINFIIDGSGSVALTGSKGYVQVPNNFVVQQWSVTSDVSTSLTVDVKKATFTNLPSTSSIVASDAPTITSNTKNSNTNVTTWTSISANDYLEFVLSTNSLAKLISVTLVGIRS